MGGQMQKCPQCAGEDWTHIVINLKEEDSVQFYACRRCEAKWWEYEGDTIALDEVLDLAARSESR
jgi:formate dehydrogenase maturation protein FdhE